MCFVLFFPPRMVISLFWRKTTIMKVPVATMALACICGAQKGFNFPVEIHKGDTPPAILVQGLRPKGMVYVASHFETFAHMVFKNIR